MNLVAIVILLALLEFVAFGILVGRARVMYGVKAPATSGNEVFERHFRVHYNTLEALIVFVPSIWLFGLYVSPQWGAGLGAVYLVGRIVYFRSYVADPAQRSVGFGMSMLPMLVLLIGALLGVGRTLV
ncbi:MAG: MAPEG family protein [Steroidobacteraceae bacterium]|jgi:glutathione S-transferase|nr:MAPEG family protein [Steroidobacteraceae bacterium]